MAYAVETVSLTKTFSDLWGRNKVFAVDNLNLKVLPNEVFGLLGPNGSGKTTTLKMLLGLLHPSKGKAFCLGGDATDPKVNARIGYLPEESYLYRYLTARETLDFYGRLFKLPAKVRKMRAEALLDMVGLKAVANRHVGTFSKGMARRIGLAQALINDPDLLILDEPTTGLDPIGTRQIKDLILALAKRGKTILLCSHLLADVEDVCDRIAILYGGKVQAEGRVGDLLKRTDRTAITASSLSETAIKGIREILDKSQAGYEISSPMDRLETFFIDVVERARRQAIPTSGAEAKTGISDFLTARAAEAAPREAILDQLVSASVSAAPELEKPQAEPRPAEPQRDEGLLKRLATSEEPASPKPVSPEAPARTEAPPAEQVRKDILDQLAGRREPESTRPGDGD